MRGSDLAGLALAGDVEGDEAGAAPRDDLVDVEGGGAAGAECGAAAGLTQPGLVQQLAHQLAYRRLGQAAGLRQLGGVPVLGGGLLQQSIQRCELTTLAKGAAPLPRAAAAPAPAAPPPAAPKPPNKVPPPKIAPPPIKAAAFSGVKGMPADRIGLSLLRSSKFSASFFTWSSIFLKKL